MTEIAALVMAIALEMGVPPYFALAIAQEESGLNPAAISPENSNGTRDYGVMQLNSQYKAYFIDLYWDKNHEFNWENPEDNIYLGCRIIKGLMEHPSINTYWVLAICYNAGCNWLLNGNPPPESSREYATRVMRRWEKESPVGAFAVISGKR